ncbi:MBL fold metallo-hydrolase [Desulfotomaculum sp. 1211_IL3151]|uniref:MBL fold metallo-hydrolase n=1 Tax=Desulfotomaculum sp. 1211_IL3151 TaxID=3084055 RepID=UPI002FD93675
MNSQELQIEYIYHSGFVVESNTALFVFDYFQGSINLKKEKQIYVFSSHAHPDHFNPVIFDWQRERPDIQYILSSDIYPLLNPKQTTTNLTFLSPYEEKKIAELQIKAYGSTDEGISFLIKYKGNHIFHAGDLNWWYWWGESQDEIENAEKMFKEEIEKIKGAVIDLAFFPVDPRLEHNYSLGAEYFIQEVKPKILIPMHFGDDSKVIHQFAEKMKNFPTKVLALTSPNSKILSL